MGLKAKDNVTSIRKIGGVEYSEKVGNPINHSKTSTGMVGMAKGITKNIGDYEFIRVDAWFTDGVRDKETLEDAFARISEMLDEVLSEEVERLIG